MCVCRCVCVWCVCGGGDRTSFYNANKIKTMDTRYDSMLLDDESCIHNVR